MGKLIYNINVSLDGYAEDADGRLDFSAPSAEVHAYINDRERQVGTYLYGRRVWDTMKVWATLDGPEPEVADYAQIWRSTDIVVFSRTLTGELGPRVRVEPEFTPEVVRELKTRSELLGIGGAELAGQALLAGLVDEISIFVLPVVIGGGKPAFPHGLRAGLELIDEHRFGNGAVHLLYAVR